MTHACHKRCQGRGNQTWKSLKIVNSAVWVIEGKSTPVEKVVPARSGRDEVRPLSFPCLRIPSRPRGPGRNPSSKSWFESWFCFITGSKI